MYQLTFMKLYAPNALDRASDKVALKCFEELF